MHFFQFEDINIDTDLVLNDYVSYTSLILHHILYRKVKIIRKLRICIVHFNL